MKKYGIWNNPELDFNEHTLLTNFLEDKEFHVERSYLGNTQAGYSTGPNVCVICEYDTLPEIGHMCGHNLIAELPQTLQSHTYIY